MMTHNSGMKYLVCALFLYGCSQLPSKPKTQDVEEDLVTARAALNQAQMSYLRGCVEAFQMLQIPKSFDTCRDKSILHREEIKAILESPIQELR